MNLKPETLKKVLYKVSETRSDEISCDTCFEEVDRFAEMLRSGDSPEKVMPLVKHHLKMCGNCTEEFEALIEAIEALEG